MILNKLTLHNFRLHRDLSISFQSPGTTLFIASNGAGKSSIVEALTWVLFGSNSLRTNQNDITTDGEQVTEVSLDFTIKSTNYILIRRRLDGCITEGLLLKDGVKIEDTLSGIAKTLSEVFLSKDKFNIGCVNQGEVDSLVFLQPSKKKLLLGSLFGVAKIDEILEKISKDYEKTKSMIPQEDYNILIANAKKLIKEKSVKLEEYTQELSEVEGRIKTLEQTNADQIKQSLSKTLLENEFKEIKKSLKFIETERNILLKELNSIPDLSGLIIKRDTLQENINNNLMSIEWINGFNNFFTHLEEYLKKGKCPVCLRPFLKSKAFIGKLTLEHNETIKIYLNKKGDLENSSKNYSKELSSLTKQIDILSNKKYNLTSKIQSLDKEYISLPEKVEKITQHLNKYKESTIMDPAKIIYTQKSLADCKTREKSLIELVSRYKVEIEYSNKDVKTYIDSIANSRPWLEETTTLHDLKQTVKSFREWVLNCLLEYVLSRTNHLLYELTNKNWNIHCSKDLDFLALLDSKPLERFSKGQICIIATALRIAMAEYLAMKANYYGPLILDGIFDVLDCENRNKLYSLLNKLKFSQILLFSHFDPQGIAGERVYL